MRELEEDIEELNQQMEAMQDTAHDEFQSKDKLLLKMHEERSKNLAKVVNSLLMIVIIGQVV